MPGIGRCAASSARGEAGGQVVGVGQRGGRRRLDAGGGEPGEVVLPAGTRLRRCAAAAVRRPALVPSAASCTRHLGAEAVDLVAHVGEDAVGAPAQRRRRRPRRRRRGARPGQGGARPARPGRPCRRSARSARSATACGTGRRRCCEGSCTSSASIGYRRSAALRGRGRPRRRRRPAARRRPPRARSASGLARLAAAGLRASAASSLQLPVAVGLRARRRVCAVRARSVVGGHRAARHPSVPVRRRTASAGSRTVLIATTPMRLRPARGPAGLLRRRRWRPGWSAGRRRLADGGLPRGRLARRGLAGLRGSWRRPWGAVPGWRDGGPGGGRPSGRPGEGPPPAREGAAGSLAERQGLAERLDLRAVGAGRAGVRGAGTAASPGGLVVTWPAPAADAAGASHHVSTRRGGALRVPSPGSHPMRVRVNLHPRRGDAHGGGQGPTRRRAGGRGGSGARRRPRWRRRTRPW